MAISPDLDFATPAFFANPYVTYRYLRDHDPIHFSERSGRWLVTRYADVDSGLRDPRWLKGGNLAGLLRLRSPELRHALEPFARSTSRQMLFSDPPDHTRLRGLVSKAFTPRMIERWRPRIEQTVHALLDRVASDGRMDLIADFADPLPSIVIAEVLGIPPEDRDAFTAWADAPVLFLGNVQANPEIDRHIARRHDEALAYFQATAARLRAQPRDDLLNAMLLAEEEGDRLSLDEWLANAVLLLAAGNETTTNLIGNGVLALLRNPDQLARLRDEPELIGTAVEEFLRYDSPGQAVNRTAPADLDLGGRTIPRGNLVSFVLGAANRDPEQFPEPDRLDVARHPNRHLAFGHGIHFCLGAPLARLEGQIAITTVLQRFPNLRLADEHISWCPNFSFRGVESLVVAW